MEKPAKNPIERFVLKIDHFQQRHPVLAFPYAVIKKYGDDDAGYQGALLTYYGFLSLFPLLIIATSIIDIVTRVNDTLRAQLLNSINNYFPAIGDDLQASIHASNKTGIALFFGLLFTFYGTRGVANAMQHALNHIWHVPKAKRAGFPKGLLKSFVLVTGAGLGFLVAAVLSSVATATFGHSLYFRLVPTVASLVMLFCVFLFVFRVGSSARRSLAELVPGAAVAAVGLQILQTIGGYLITHELHNFKGTYGRFGLILAILFWIYLQAQVLLYAAEVSAVRAMKLWPRSITNNPPTAADEIVNR
jgi:membrane protein